MGEVCAIVRGNRVTKSDLIKDGTYPVISGGVSPLGFIDKFNREAHTITIAQYGSAGYVDIQPNRFWANDVCYSLYPNEGIINLFLYYSLKNKQREIYALRTNAVPAHLPQKDLSNLEIPIPSLSEQQRIVSILDTFTSSISNLKQQIEERRKQYEYERDLLLDLEGKEGVEMKKLGEVCKLERGVRVVKKDLQEEGIIPVYQNSLTPLGYYDKSNYPENTTFVICAGAAGEVGFSNKAFWAADDCTCVVCPDFIHGKFIFHYLMSNQRLLKSQVRKASVPRLSKDVIGKLIVPFPSLQAQSRIVSILDTFEQSIANLEEQLAMREKQYEYYREKLLRFEEA